MKSNLRRSRRKCFISSCTSSIRKVETLFVFSNKYTKFQQWIENCNIPYPNTKKIYICRSHFEKECIGKRNLKKNAVPTLNLPPTNIDYFKNKNHKRIESFSDESEDDVSLISILSTPFDENISENTSLIFNHSNESEDNVSLITILSNPIDENLSDEFEHDEMEFEYVLNVFKKDEEILQFNKENCIKTYEIPKIDHEHNLTLD